MHLHGPMISADRVDWRVWAPLAQRVDLNICIQHHSEIIPMTRQDGGWFETSRPRESSEIRYFFRLDGNRDRPDPASRWQPEGIHKPSALFFPDDFVWCDADWKGIPRSDLVLYELHVGTFTPEGTFDAVIPRLSELRDLGVTAIELMPVAQFPGIRDWGYHGVHPFAVQNSYGGPHGLQRLVNACHEHGLALFLDVVYNHLGPEGNYLGEFGPYFNDKYLTPWGVAVNFDASGCGPVRQFVLENVRYWLREFHVDGLRLDAVHAIFDRSDTHILREIQQIGEAEERLQGRFIHVIAESNQNDPRLLEAEDRQGFGLAAVWNDDFHHAVHTLMTGERNGYYMDFGHPEQLAKALNDNFVYDGRHSPFHGRIQGAPARHLGGDRFVVSIQNHDQIGNRARGDRLALSLTPEQLRFAAGLMLLSPFTPLLFMGEEYGEQRPFPFFCSFLDSSLNETVQLGRQAEFADAEWSADVPPPHAEETFQSAILRWSWPADSWHAGLRNWYRTLLRARRRIPQLHGVTDRTVQWHDRTLLQVTPSSTVRERTPAIDLLAAEADNDGLFELIRGNPSQGNDAQIVAYFNFSHKPQYLTDLYVERNAPAGWIPVLSSEWPTFGGRHPGSGHPTRTATTWELLPFEVLVFCSTASRPSISSLLEDKPVSQT
ncbi:MAG: malto-oligosyltrehalose trehalohydrolase [Planctomycetes bacterium]|nr:malto-oligosyltrehalose trehalohydrolase [Planctomycetota bacterium]